MIWRWKLFIAPYFIVITPNSNFLIRCNNNKIGHKNAKIRCGDGRLLIFSLKNKTIIKFSLFLSKEKTYHWWKKSKFFSWKFFRIAILGCLVSLFVFIQTFLFRKKINIPIKNSHHKNNFHQKQWPSVEYI